MSTNTTNSNTLSIENNGKYINMVLGSKFICLEDKNDLTGLVWLDSFSDGIIKLVVERVGDKLDIISIDFKKLLLERFEIKNSVDEIINSIKYIEIVDKDTGDRSLIDLSEL